MLNDEHRSSAWRVHEIAHRFGGADRHTDGSNEVRRGGRSGRLVPGPTVQRGATLSQGAGATLTVLHGQVRVERVVIGGRELCPPRPGLLAAGSSHELG
jgi:hypothetical protein